MFKDSYVVKTRSHSRQSVSYGNWSITQIYYSYQTIYREARMSCRRIIRVKDEIGLSIAPTLESSLY